MKQIRLFNRIFANLLLVFIFIFGAVPLFHQDTYQAYAQAGTCADKVDNDGDGRADWNGVQGVYPPDPSCINKNSQEVTDGNCKDGIDNNDDGKTDSADPACKAGGVIEGSLIPCDTKCDLGSVFSLLNNLITFLIKVILFPISILMFVYAGYKYITAQGNPAKKANIKKMIGHLILGIVIILTSWVIVKTLLGVIGYDQTLYFFSE